MHLQEEYLFSEQLILTVNLIFFIMLTNSLRKRFIISSMYNPQQEVVRHTPKIHLIKLITIFAVLFTPCHTETCTKDAFQNSTGKQCIFRYSFQCNNTQTKAFDYCRYKVCLDQSHQGTCNSPASFQTNDQTNCTNTCKNNTDQIMSSKSWLTITVVVLCIAFITITCGCIARRCCTSMAPDRSQFIIQMRPAASADQNEIESDRRLSSWNYLEFELKWEKIDQNRSWIDQQETCVICLEKGLNCCLPCRHYFHKNCIKEWLILRQNCPTCKAQRFEQVILRCSGCKVMQMGFFVEQLKKIQIDDLCPSCK